MLNNFGQNDGENFENFFGYFIDPLSMTIVYRTYRSRSNLYRFLSITCTVPTGDLFWEIFCFCLIFHFLYFHPSKSKHFIFHFLIHTHRLHSFTTLIRKNGGFAYVQAHVYGSLHYHSNLVASNCTLALSSVCYREPFSELSLLLLLNSICMGGI